MKLLCLVPLKFSLSAHTSCLLALGCIFPLPVSAALSLSVCVCVLPSLPLLPPIALCPPHATGTKSNLTSAQDNIDSWKRYAFLIRTYTNAGAAMSYLKIWSRLMILTWDQPRPKPPNIKSKVAKLIQTSSVCGVFFIVASIECLRSNQDKLSMCKFQTNPNQSCAPLALSQKKRKKKFLAKIQHSWGC